MQDRSNTLNHFAIQHRCLLTCSEAALWRLIQGRKTGVWFRRQVVIGRFIVDFLAPAARLIVEVDGGYRARRRSADARRDCVLTRLGYHVLRLDADLVVKHPEEAIARIRAAPAR